MSEPMKVDPGRLDHLAHALFKKLLKMHANPEVQFACKMLNPEIGECFAEHLGPGTEAHKIGQRFLRAIGEKD